MRVSIPDLTSTTRQAIRNSGYNLQETEIILDVLLYAQLRGNNQGIVKLVGAGMPKDHEAGDIRVVRETKLSALLDGQHNQGMVVMNQAVEMALGKAHEHGFGIVGTNNTFSSTGAIGYYAQQIAEAGFLGFVFSGSPELVAMYGSYRPLFGTNPLAIGIPSEDDPIVFDMATAAIALYGIIEAKTAGQRIPEGVAYDASGNLTVDPVAALGGAIRAFGEHKGAGLGLVVEVLTRSLVATTPDEEGRKTDWGNLVFVIDPELLIDRAKFKTRVAELVQQVKQMERLPGVEEILVPGERGKRMLQNAIQSGEVEIEDNLWAELQKVAQQA